MQTFVMDNPEVERRLDMASCIDAIAEAYTDLGRDQAIAHPRTDVYMPSPDGTPDTYYVFKSMVGAMPTRHTVALRINSDRIRWVHRGDVVLKQRVASAGCLTLLFDTRDGELRAVVRDDIIEKMRVAATTAVAARALARPDSRSVGLLGTGGQAKAALEALSGVLSLEEVSVYSPTRSHLESFLKEMGEKLPRLQLTAASSPEDAVRGRDVIMTATNAMNALLDPTWLAIGSFVACVKPAELGDAVIGACDQTFVHFHQQGVVNYLVGHGPDPVVSMDPGDVLGALGSSHEVGIDISRQPDLAAVLAGRAGRNNSKERICFLNNIGTGLQFAAVGGYLLESLVGTKPLPPSIEFWASAKNFVDSGGAVE